MSEVVAYLGLKIELTKTTEPIGNSHRRWIGKSIISNELGELRGKRGAGATRALKQLGEDGF